MANLLDANKQMVRDLYDLAFNQKQPAEAATRYVDPTYRQHNPGAGDGVAPFVSSVTGFVTAFPTLRVTRKRLVAEGDLVVLHSHFLRQLSERGLAVMDIFRLEAGKIVEHWGVLQEVPDTSANAMF